MDDKRWPNWVGGLLIAAAFVAFIAFVVVRTTHIDTYTGRVVKMWQQGTWSYVTVEQADGSRVAFSVFPTTYGVLDIGESCTFHVDNQPVAQQVENCQRGNGP